jgi:hypothetical protein
MLLCFTLCHAALRCAMQVTGIVGQMLGAQGAMQ